MGDAVVVEGNTKGLFNGGLDRRSRTFVLSSYSSPNKKQLIVSIKSEVERQGDRSLSSTSEAIRAVTPIPENSPSSPTVAYVFPD